MRPTSLILNKKYFYTFLDVYVASTLGCTFLNTIDSIYVNFGNYLVLYYYYLIFYKTDS